MARHAAAFLIAGALVTLCGCGGPGRSNSDAAPRQSQPPAATGDIHQFSAESIDGRSVDLSAYRGKVLLIVNVASLCGNTPQYAGLQNLYEQKRDEGLVVLGFPANDFGNQEPGSNEDIKAFCERKYQVTFPLFAKIHVKGPEKHPLYAWLTDKQIHTDHGGEIQWNFTKFLVGRDGRVVARFRPGTPPSDPEVVEAVEGALASG